MSLCQEFIEAFVNRSGKFIVGDLENGEQDEADNVSWIFEAS